jgi:hypothetical protein
MALSCAGLKLRLGSGVVSGDSYNPMVLLLEREEPTTAKSLSQWSYAHDHRLADPEKKADSITIPVQLSYRLYPLRFDPHNNRSTK